MFYATARDLSVPLGKFEAMRPVQYIATGLFKSAFPQTYSSHLDIPDLGRARHPNAISNVSYLVASKGTSIEVRSVPQKSGGILFAVDQLHNPDTIAFSPGGRFGNDVILYGRVSTVSDSIESADLYELFLSAFRKHFRRQQEYLVGQEANEAWRAGVRLTVGASSSAEFDLKREPP